MQLIRANTNINFLSQTRTFGVLSVAAVVFFLGLMFTRGFNLGIEFVGGTTIQIQLPESATNIAEGELRAAMQAIGHPAEVVRFGEAADREFTIRIRADQADNQDLTPQILNGLSEQLSIPVASEDEESGIVLQKVDSIGPRVGDEMQRDGFKAVGYACIAILFYVWVRFDRRYAPGAVAALLHDVIITAGIFSLFQIEFNQQTLAALLVVIGYSLNDTIVIYDRIRENLELRGTTHLKDVINQSINQTLSRTLLTSLTTLLVVLSLLLFGGPVIRGFAVALLIGVTIGTYSTIYVASALLVLLERYWAESSSAAAAKA